MSYAHALSQYDTTGPIATAREQSPHRLIEMLLSGALSRIGTARQALRRNDCATRGSATTRAIEILGYLDAILDRQQGGTLAGQLEALYGYAIRRLALANATADDALFAEVASLVANIKNAWDAVESRAHANDGVIA